MLRFSRRKHPLADISFPKRVPHLWQASALRHTDHVDTIA